MLKKLTYFFLLLSVSIFSQTLEEAGISQRAIGFIANSGFEQQITNSTAFNGVLNGIIFSEPVPSASDIVKITTIDQLLNLSSDTKYFADGDFVLTPEQTINVPSGVTLYIRGRIFKRGRHNTIVPESPNLIRENNVEHIFEIRSNSNIRIIGIDNALIESNGADDVYNRATAFYIVGNSNNIEIRGLHIKNVWEGFNCRFEVDRVLIRNNYIQNTNKRAFWFLGANECTAVHNFIENAGWDGFDFDAFAGNRLADTRVDRRVNAIGSAPNMPSQNGGNTAFENIVVGAGRFMGFVEEGARDNFIVNNIGIMANYLPANPIRLSFQVGWADNASTEEFFEDTGLRTEDNAFIDNAIYRPEAYNVEVRAGRVRGTGDYFAKIGDQDKLSKGLTYFFSNDAFGTLQNGQPLGKGSGIFLANSVCSDEVPTNFSSFDNRYEDYNPRARIKALEEAFRKKPMSAMPFPPRDCSVQPTGLRVSRTTETSITVAYDIEPDDSRKFELRAYEGGTFTGTLSGGGVFAGYSFTVEGNETLTMNGLESGRAYDLVLRALCSPGTSPLTVISGSTKIEIPPSCDNAPTGATIDSFTENSITLTFDNTESDARKFDLKAYAPGTFTGNFESGALAFATVDRGNNSIMINSLESGTFYDLVLRSLCDSTFSPPIVIRAGTTGPANCANPPSGLNVISSTDSTITVGFDNLESDLRRFELRAYTEGTYTGSINGSSVGFALVNEGSNSITMKGLEPNTRYELGLRALCNTNASILVGVTGSTTEFLPKDCSAAPTGLSVSEVSDTSVTVTFDNTTGDGRRFELRAFESGTFTGDINVGSSVLTIGSEESTTLTVDGLVPGTLYDIVLVALCGEEVSPVATATATTSIFTPGDCSIAPTGLAVSEVSETSVTITFDNSPRDGRTFELRAFEAGTFTGDINAGSSVLTIGSEESTTLTVDGLVSGTMYDIVLVALCGTSVSPVATATAITSGFTPGDCSISPTGLAVSEVSETSVTITFDNSPRDGRRFELRAFEEGTFTGNINDGAVAFAFGAEESTFITIQGLTSGTSYDLVIRSLCGSSASSVAVITGITDGFKPGDCSIAPTGFVATNVTENSVTVTYDNTIRDGRRFELRAFEEGLFTGDPNAGVSILATGVEGSTSITLDGLVSGTTYDLVLTGICDTVASPFSSLKITTDGFRPGDCSVPPSGVVVTDITETTITLSYDNSATDGRTFELRAFVEGTFFGNINDPFESFASSNMGSSSITVTNLVPGTAYELVLRSLCVSSSSTNAVLPARTILDSCEESPRGLTLVDITENSATFSFDNSVENSRIFEIRAYPPNGLVPSNININAVGYGSADPGSSTVTINNLASNTTYDFSIRALCLEQSITTSRTSPAIRATTNESLAKVLSNEKEIGIYPNPTTGKIFVSQRKGFDKISIVNIAGIEIATFDTNLEELDLSLFAANVYFVKFFNSSTGKVVFKRVVKN